MPPGESVHEAALAALRAGHFLACMLLFGEVLFVAAIEPRARIRVRWMFAGIGVALACAVGWLGLTAIAMSGEAPADALRPHVLALVLGGTQFGRVWALRAGELVLIALGVGFVMRARTPRVRRTGLLVLLLLCAHHLVLLAWMGHAAAAAGPRLYAELGVDAVHLLAAGAWLGSLPALVAVLRVAPSAHAAIGITQRYSVLGLASVAIIVATGVLNASFRSVDPQALVTTDYGRLLLAKLVLFAAMLVLAAHNRFRLTQRLTRDDPRALGALRRNATLEIVAGIAVIALVGALGITPPPAMSGMHMPGM